MLITVLGVVLCGGQSSRMGKDKGLLQVQGHTWAEHAAQKFALLQLPFVYSVAQHHMPAYAVLFDNKHLVLDNDLPVGGPLKGILSVHCKYPERDLLVLAVDLPGITTNLLQSLLDTASKEYTATVFQNNTQLEPLCSLYRADGLKQILDMANKGTLQRFSMHYVLQQLHTQVIVTDAAYAAEFTNCNAPDDLKHLRL